MALMPGANWRPLPPGAVSTARMAAFDIVCLHTMVGSLAGTDVYFRTGRANSHFGTGGDGTIYQWVDTAIQSWANLNGNPRVISIENADIGPEFPKWNTNSGAEVPAFTDAQIEANARICAWANQAHGIPLELIPDSKPGRRGIGYHRQGVPGYMVAGGEQWSTAVGKVCPGDRRVAQIPRIIARARELAGTPTPPPPTAGGLPGKPAWALPSGHWLGNVAGGATQHGGVPYDNATVVGMVRHAQRVFIATGCVPGVTDWRNGWADGKWESATDAACRRWFGKFRPGQQFSDRLYSDDWAVL